MLEDELRIISDYRTFLQVEKRLADSTVHRYVEAVQTFLHFYQKQIASLSWANSPEWIQVTRRDIEIFFKYYQQEKRQWSLATCSNVLIALRSFFSFLTHTGQLLHSPIQHYTLPQSPSEVQRQECTAEAVREYLEKEPVGWDARVSQLLIELIYGLGWRFSKAARIEGVSWPDDEKNVCFSWGVEEELVSMGTVGLRRLRQYQSLKQQLPGAITFWVGESGGELSATDLRKRVKAALQSLGLETVRQLQNLSTQHFLDQGAGVRSVQQLRKSRKIRQIQSLKTQEFAELQAQIRTSHPLEALSAKTESSATPGPHPHTRAPED